MSFTSNCFRSGVINAPGARILFIFSRTCFKVALFGRLNNEVEQTIVCRCYIGQVCQFARTTGATVCPTLGIMARGSGGCSRNFFFGDSRTRLVVGHSVVGTFVLMYVRTKVRRYSRIVSLFSHYGFIFVCHTRRT